MVKSTLFQVRRNYRSVKRGVGLEYSSSAVSEDSSSKTWIMCELSDAGVAKLVNEVAYRCVHD